MNKGKLFGVGVGPGATDLLTLRAVRVLNTVDVIAIPKGSEFAEPFAWRICAPVVEERPGLIKLHLLFPMTKDPAILVPAWEKAFDEIEKHLDASRTVAFITQGDPSVYSSWIYLQEELTRRRPDYATEVLPAVSSITAVPALLGTPLADGEERFCVLPATYGLEDLPRLLEDFDTIVLTKVGRMIRALVEILKPRGLLNKATYVSYGTTTRQRIVRDLESLQEESCDYFSMVIISIRKRKGVLRGGQNE